MLTRVLIGVDRILARIPVLRTQSLAVIIAALKQ